MARRRGGRLAGRLTERRRRRAPEVARSEILDAADRVFIEFQPDQVGLKDIARGAGVSHALITHYFGTYAGLIEATLERRLRNTREETLARLEVPGALTRPGELLDVLFRSLDDPVHLRLMRWVLASERPTAATAFGGHEQGLQRIAQRVAAALHPTGDPAFVARVEVGLLTAVSAAYGYALAKDPLVAALGRQPSGALDRDVKDALAAMLQLYIRTVV